MGHTIRTDKKENKIFLIYIRKFRGIGCKVIYMTKGVLVWKNLRIPSYIRKPFLIYDFVPPSHLNFLIFEENFVFFFISASYKTKYYFQSIFNGFPFNDFISLTMNCLEDCLYLNIWVPASVLESSPLSPVLTWIYGGTFLLITQQRISDIPAGDGKIAKPFLQCIGLRRENITDITVYCRL